MDGAAAAERAPTDLCRWHTHTHTHTVNALGVRVQAEFHLVDHPLAVPDAKNVENCSTICAYVSFILASQRSAQ